MDNRITLYFAIDNLAKMFSHNESLRSSVMPGGVEIVLYDLVNRLVDEYDYYICFLTYDLDDEHIDERMEIYNITHKKKRAFIDKVLLRLNLKHANVFPGERRALLYIAQAEGAQLVDAAKREGIPVLFRINGDSIVDVSICPDPCYPMVRKNMAKADFIIAESQYELDLLKKNFGLDGELFYKGFSFPKLEPIEKKPQVLWIGRSVNLKRPEKFLELAEAMPHIHFVMVCPEADVSCFEVTKRHAESLENVKFYKSVPRHDLMQIYNESGVVVSTSTTEAVVNTLVEATEYNAAFVSLEIDAGGLLGRLGDESKIGLSAFGDFTLFKDYVERMLNDKQLVAEYHVRGIRYSKDHWNIDEYARKHDMSIRRLAK